MFQLVQQLEQRRTDLAQGKPSLWDLDETFVPRLRDAYDACKSGDPSQFLRREEVRDVVFGAPRRTAS